MYFSKPPNSLPLASVLRLGVVGNEARRGAQYNIRKGLLFHEKHHTFFSNHLVDIQFFCLSLRRHSVFFLPSDTYLNILQITITCVSLLQDCKFL